MLKINKAIKQSDTFLEGLIFLLITQVIYQLNNNLIFFGLHHMYGSIFINAVVISVADLTALSILRQHYFQSEVY